MFLFLPQLDETATIRVTNLSEDTRENDLNELFRPFGYISRIFLAKDKITNQSKVRCLTCSQSSFGSVVYFNFLVLNKADS